MTGKIDELFSSRHLPWDKIGKTINDPHVTAAEAAKLGGLDFDVSRHPIGYRNDRDEWVEIPTRDALVDESDPGNPRWLSIVSDDYRVVQYAEAFNFLDEINPRYVAAGTLSNGRQGFLIIQLPGHETLDYAPGGEADPQQLYVLVRTSHDLSKAIEVAVLTLRNKCMNQLTLPSLTKDAPQRWVVRHVGDPASKLKEAQRVLTGSQRYTDVISRRIEQLTNLQVTPRRLKILLKHVLRPTLANRDQMIDNIMAVADRPTVGFAGTGWGAVNTVSEYFQWGRSTATRTPQSIFTDSFDGDAARYVNKIATALLADA
jgi:phage/plasmid-like protein (TIGR03299 family)